MKKTAFLLGLIFWLSPLVLTAQYGLNLGLRPQFVTAQAWQPAYLLDAEYHSVALGFHGAAWFNNSDVSLRGVFDEDGYITPETRARIVSQAKGTGFLNGGYVLHLACANFRIGDMPFSVNLTERQHNTLRINNPLTVGLFLQGNKPYAGQTITDTDIFAKQYHTRELGLGTAFEMDKLKLGVRLKLMQGVKFFDLARADYSLYTAEDGTQIDFSVDYELYRSLSFSPGLFDFQGFGAAVELGAVYEASEDLTLQGSILDLGATVYKSQRNAAVADVVFEGISVNSIFQDSLPEVAQQQADSLLNLLLPDSTLENHTLLAPLQIRLGGTYRLNEKSAVSGTLVYAPVPTGAWMQVPLLSIAYQRELVEGLELSVNGYGGGADLFGLGAAVSYDRQFGERFGLQAILGSDNFLGMIPGAPGRGMGAFGGLGLRF